MLEKYSSTPDYQDRILACIIQHPERFMCYGGVLSAAYFSGTPRIVTARTMFGYCKKHNRYPAWDVLVERVKDAIDSTPDQKHEEDITDYLNRLKEMGTGDIDSVVEDVVKFARKRAYLIALEEAFQYWQQGKEPAGGFEALFKTAAQVGVNFSDLGYLIGPNQEDSIISIIEEYLERKPGIQLGGKFYLLDEIWQRKGGIRPGWLIAILAPPKRYKCWGKGTGILMFDGSVKPVEDIKVDDLVMGDDSTPRRVLSCGKGRGPMFSVKQRSGKDFICNDAHILCLKSPKGDIKEMTTQDYSKQRPWFQRTWQGYKQAIEFPERQVPLDPYFVGLWLGDGTSGEAEVCVADKDLEIVKFIEHYAEQIQMRVSSFEGQSCQQLRLVKRPSKRGGFCSVEGCGQPHRVGGFCNKHYCQARYHEGFKVLPPGQTRWQNTVVLALKNLGIYRSKQIPEVYKINSRSLRLKLLAGLIDSDGHFYSNRGFVCNFTNEQLANDICWLARSLGFLAEVWPFTASIKSRGYACKAWRVTISGALSQIPTLVPRKRGVDSFKHRNGRYKIKVTPIGEGDYYGFTLDQNERLMLDDFTVSHNTTLCVNLALNIAYGGRPVFYYPCEITQIDAAIRTFQCLTDSSDQLLVDNPASFTKLTIDRANETMGAPVLIKGYPMRSVTIAGDIRSHSLASRQQLGLEPAAIFIDHAETLRCSSTKKDISDHRAQGEIYVEAKNLAVEMGCPVFLPDRCNAETVERLVPSMKSFQGAFEKAGHVDGALGLCATEEEHLQNQIRYFLFLNRHGAAGLHFRGIVNPDTQRMTMDTKIPWNPEDDDYDRYKKGGKGGKRRPRAFDPDKMMAD
jgi:hypothetical protein